MHRNILRREQRPSSRPDFRDNYNWIKKLDENFQSSNSTEEKKVDEPQTVDVIEMDELFAYTKEKKQNLGDNAGDEENASNHRF